MVAQTYNPSTSQVEEARESVVQGHCQLYTEFKDSPHLKPQKQFYSKKSIKQNRKNMITSASSRRLRGSLAFGLNLLDE